MTPGWIRFNLTIALVLSLTAHWLLARRGIQEQINGLLAALMAGQPGPVQVASSSAAVRPEPAPTVDEILDVDLEFGDWNGKGEAIASAEGDQPLAGRRGSQNQPLLSRDPVGQGRVGDLPTNYTGPTGAGGSAIAKLRELVAPEEPAVAMMRFPNEAETYIAPRPPRVAGAENAPPAAPAAGPAVVAVAAPAAPAKPQAADTNPGAPVASADPAPLSDSEIDLFSKAPTLEFRQGKAVAQFGRKATLTRPRIPLVGLWDAFAQQRTVRVGLILKTDEAGKVVDARVGRSAGSSEIDNPVRREAYNWSFDPGEPDHPLPREFPVIVAIIVD